MNKLPPILLIDDERGDAMLVGRACKDLQISNPVTHFFNGKEALEYLRNENNKKPFIILTDLNTPEMNGGEFLKVVKADDILKKIPVIVLSGSGNDEDVDKCFGLGAAGYMVKPFGYKELLEMIATIFSYWTLSQLPNKQQMALQNFSA
ncbi:MAG: response regulator [Planctomycetes bacterium]|nr:response regulator [Planctomycetota bacterium]